MTKQCANRLVALQLDEDQKIDSQGVYEPTIDSFSLTLFSIPKKATLGVVLEEAQSTSRILGEMAHDRQNPQGKVSALISLSFKLSYTVKI